MNHQHLDTLVQAVLYEGYILYPYRPSSAKNRQRFTFGRVYPQAYSAAQRHAEPCLMRTECLVERTRERTGADARLEVSVRFLHPMAREAGRLAKPLAELPVEPDFEVVPELRVGDRRYQTWQEAVEREVPVPALRLEPTARRVPFEFPATRTLEPIRDAAGQVVGVLVRRQEALAGEVEVTVERVADDLFELGVEVRNRTPVPEAALAGPDEEVVLRTFASTHTILRADGGAFVSLMDPPAAHAGALASCTNIGTWPVLVGEVGERDTMLSSPIILYDYPQIAPESTGDLYDGLEIDEMLTLRIQTLTDDEKDEMRAADEHARRLLHRSETMPDDALLNMHGAIRETRPHFDDDFFDPNTRLDGVYVGEVYCRAGDRVVIRPKTTHRADIMDLALDGRTAVIEAVEQDFEHRVHLALVIEDDPGADLGMLRQPGHRFFFAPDEVEPVREEA